jgi:hypothetical protein
MDSDNICLGKAYECKPVGMQRNIIGEVIRKMENCVVMSVVRYDELDHGEIEERCGKVVTRYCDIYESAMIESFFR